MPTPLTCGDLIHAIFAMLTPDERAPLRWVCSPWRDLVDERFPGDRAVRKMRVAWSVFERHGVTLPCGGRMLPDTSFVNALVPSAFQKRVFDTFLQSHEVWRGQRTECEPTLITAHRRAGKTWAVALFAAAAAWCIDGGESVCLVRQGYRSSDVLSSMVAQALRTLAKHDAPGSHGLRGAMHRFRCCTLYEPGEFDTDMLIFDEYDGTERANFTWPPAGTQAGIVGATTATAGPGVTDSTWHHVVHM